MTGLWRRLKGYFTLHVKDFLVVSRHVNSFVFIRQNQYNGILFVVLASSSVRLYLGTTESNEAHQLVQSDND